MNMGARRKSGDPLEIERALGGAARAREVEDEQVTAVVADRVVGIVAHEGATARAALRRTELVDLCVADAQRGRGSLAGRVSGELLTFEVTLGFEVFLRGQ